MNNNELKYFVISKLFMIDEETVESLYVYLDESMLINNYEDIYAIFHNILFV